MQDWLLAIIQCPLTREPLCTADQRLVDQLQEQYRSGSLNNRLGIMIDQPFEAGLVNLSRTLFYPVRDGIPTLIPGEAVEIPGEPADL